MEERLQKYLARCGVASRRKCEDIIMKGRVQVNDKIVNQLGTKIDETRDIIKVNNKIVQPEKNKLYIALNKPLSYLSSVKDERGRKTIIDLVNVPERIYPIGRLDYDTTGLILLTNDGDVYNKVIHPRQSIDKTYIAVVRGEFKEDNINKLRNGVDIGDYITSSAKVSVLSKGKNVHKIKISIHEGKNRQVRRMFEAINLKVIELDRISIGKLTLNKLPLGQWRYLTEKEVNYLKGL